MPSLSPEVGRAGGTAHAVFERHLRKLVETVAEKPERASWDRQRAISAIALCVGGLMLARAVQDRTFSDEILSACRSAVVGKDH